ncbi:hypothetical protein DFP93_102105 [Aneurinibacillus soli]|uniref:Pycsar effector protein domain-containing protein n=1 Tax=Aneurinibacillus soli TaxID=1500254 RepID=A0A0U5B2V5_9BACL|nr:hypothetical protein [Aneurinibacillus soli]PYE63421.1 hypothetical protein DFP93_102105 [Aneurinibacillus soli]BAU27647.1 hypothetical protein CB4_01821 [Aneurinibacillus soli]
MINDTNNPQDEKVEDKKIELLYKAIEDNQNTIRFTDTKAGAILVLTGIVITFFSGFSKDFYTFIKGLLYKESTSGFEVLASLAYISMSLLGIYFIIRAIRLALLVISPKSGPIKSIKKDTPKSIPNLFYLNELEPSIEESNIFNDEEGTFKLTSPTSYLLNELDHLTVAKIQHILVYELQKVSYIREMKIQRVKWSIKFLGYGTLILIAVTFVVVIQNLFT